MTQSIEDTPMHRVTIDELDPETLEQFILVIRERRLKPVRLYEEQQEQVKSVRDERLRASMEKELKGFKKDLERVDAVLTKLEKRALKIKTIRFEIDMD